MNHAAAVSLRLPKVTIRRPLLPLRSAAAGSPAAAPARHARGWRSTAQCAALLAAALLAGCSSLLVHPDTDVSQAVPVPAVWDHGTASTAATSLAEWWRHFHDPQLTAVVTQVLAANGDVRTAQATLRQVRAQRDVTAAGLLPTVGGNASASRTRSGGNDGNSSYAAGFDASWEPDVFGGTRAGVTAADADTRAAVVSLANVQVSIAAEAAAQYITWTALELRMAIARDNLASQEETQQITEWRAQAGLTTSLDVEQARSSTEVTRAQIPALTAGIAQAKSALAVLAGVTPEALQATLKSNAVVPVVDEGLAYSFPAETLRQRPDVHKAEYQLQAAASRVTQSDAARYPSFQISGTLGVAALTFGGLTGGNALAALLLGSISVPIFNGGALEAQVRVQDAAFDQARIAYETTVLAALKDVEDALVTLASARERLATLRRAALAARNASILARYRYNSGLSDFQPVLQTQVTLLSVQDSVANGEAELGLAHVRLYKALGGGWQPDAAATPQARTGAPAVTFGKQLT